MIESEQVIVEFGAIEKSEIQVDIQGSKNSQLSGEEEDDQSFPLKNSRGD